MKSLSLKLVIPALSGLIAMGAFAQSIQSSSSVRTATSSQAIAAPVVTTANLGAGSISTFCDSMDPNTSGLSTTLTGTLGSGIGSGLHLEVTQGPANQFGYFRVGTAVSDPGVMLGQGRLCLAIAAGNVIGRYTVAGGARNSIGQFDSNGVLQNLAGTSTTGTGFDVPVSVPISGDPVITSGATWHFQIIHREPGGTWNYSNGLTVTFP